jgi:hypothetical protein
MFCAMAFVTGFYRGLVLVMIGNYGVFVESYWKAKGGYIIKIFL